jgi:hypothetical protein
MSRRYPKWIKQQIEKIATYIITKSDIDVVAVVKQAFEDLDYGRFEPRDMRLISITCPETCVQRACDKKRSGY